MLRTLPSDSCWLAESQHRWSLLCCHSSSRDVLLIVAFRSNLPGRSSLFWGVVFFLSINPFCKWPGFCILNLSFVADFKEEVALCIQRYDALGTVWTGNTRGCWDGRRGKDFDTVRSQCRGSSAGRLLWTFRREMGNMPAGFVSDTQGAIKLLAWLMCARDAGNPLLSC